MKKILLFLGLFLTVATSCDEGFGELNENPLAPTNVNDGALFNSIVASVRLGWNRQLFLHNEVLYDVTEQAAVTAQTFGNISGGSEEVWSNYYGALKNARELEHRYAALENSADADIVRSMVRILMAYKTFQVTDLFGDIPYTEAGRAFAEDVVLQPVYDSQEDIYKANIDLLIESVDLIRNGSGTLRFGNFDTLFGDNTDTWVRFANSLLLRHLVRMYDADPDFAGTRIQSLLTGGNDVVVKNGDLVMSPARQGWDNLGVNWSFREHNRVRLGSTMWETLTDAGEIIDPRLGIFYEPNNAGEWAPFPQVPEANTPQSGGDPYESSRRDASYEDKGVDNIYSPVNYYLIRDEQDIPEILITSAEVKFLLAEIYERGLGVAADPFLANDNYQFGMLESLEYWQGLVVQSSIWVNKPELQTAGELFNVLIHPKYELMSITDPEERLRRIYTQRWIDSFRQPWEAFAVLRRTGGLVPRTGEPNTFNRFEYPPSELAFNEENYLSQTQRMGGDLTSARLWWMN